MPRFFIVPILLTFVVLTNAQLAADPTAVPDSPDGFVASNGNEQVTLTWDAPAEDADIVRHEYRFKTTGDYPDEWTEIDDSAPGGLYEDWVVVTGLTNDVAYTFQLRTVNGDGDVSTAVEAGPATPRSGICGRTEQVRDAIVVAINDESVSDCADVTPDHLAYNVAILYIDSRGIRSLQPDDFSGLARMGELHLSDNELSSLPAGVFSDLTKLYTLDLSSNELSSLSADVFSGLTALETLWLDHNELSSLSAGVFSGLTTLRWLLLDHNELSSLSEDVFSGLTALETLHLEDNELSSLSEDVFSGLTALVQLWLEDNKLSSLSADVFSGLTALQTLRLQSNELSSLSADVFSGLTTLNGLSLGDNPNTGDVLPLPVTVEKVGTNQVRAKVLAGAPFAVDFTPTVVNGWLPSGVTKLGVPAGSVDGTAVTVTRTSGTMEAVTVDIDLTTQPTLPPNHSGYTFARASSGLPATILPADSGDGALPTLSIADAAGTEGGNVTFTVRLSAAAAAAVTATWTASIESGDTADLSDDLGTPPTGMVTVTAGERTETFPVPTAQDDLAEGNETFTVTLSGVSSNAQLAANPTATGTINDDEGNVVPAFSSSAFDAAENQTAAGTVLATDSDAEDDITGYAITGGADQSFFSIGSTSGELTFDDAPNYEDAKDANTDNDYEVTVQATSGTGGRVKTATQTITVTVTDDNTEAPGAPAAPTVTAASATSLSVSWTAPANAGPAITDYDYRHRTTSPEGTWTEVTGTTITTLSATITGLSENTSYDVQVRATNDEGTGSWSDAGSGSIMPPDPPAGFMASSIKEQVTLTWTAPDAGADITHHEYRFKTTGEYPDEWTEIDDSAPGGAHEDWVVVMSLTNDVAYTFQLRAVNAAGASTAVEADPVTPTMSGVCGRTEQVRDAIVDATGVSDCADVTTAQLAGVTDLDLSNAGIRSLQPDDFSGLTKLRSLDLYDNELSSLPAGVFSGLTALWTLSLSNNEFSSLPVGVFSGLTALRWLYLSSNELSSLPVGVFTGLTALKSLSLGSNEFSSLPAGVFTGLTALWTLYLQDNSLSLLPAGVFSDLTSLFELNLYDNELRSLPVGVFSGLTKLRTLNLYDNELRSLPVGVFSDLTALFDLQLDNNELSLLPDGVFTGLTALLSLNLDNNELSSLSAGVFTGLTALSGLVLSNNEFSPLPDALPAGVFSGLTALRFLDLSSNEFSSLSDDVFTGLTALQTLYLNNNEFSSLSDDVFSGLTTLGWLRLEDNELSSLSAGVFTDLTALQTLWLQNNELSSLSAGVFSGLTKLRELDLSSNELSSLPAGVFSGLTTLNGLRLEDNPNTGDVLPLTVTVEKVGTNQVRTKVLAGAPFAVDFTPTVVNGWLPSGVTKLAVPAGSVDGTAVTVTRTSGTTAAVTVDIDLTTQPTLPPNHSGYEFVKATESEPKEILPAETGDGALPTLSIADAAGTEGGNVTFTVTLSAEAAADVTATWTATIESGNTAVLADDLGATTTGMVTVTAGELTGTFPVPTVPDATDEENETFTVTLSVVSSNAQLAADPTATGTINDDDEGNAAPAFSTSAFDAAENQTAAGTVVATDSDEEDDITGYEITGGADQALFEIGATSGALTFKTAPNFEDAKDIVSVDPANAAGNNEYVVVVTATSGTGTREKTAEQTITVTVTDVTTEAPGQPAAPTVTAASTTSLSVSWTAPANAGPAITDYDYRHRTTSPQGTWTEVTGTTITTLSATITGLSENTSYDVQVRATNAEGTGDWSDSGSGATAEAANAAPAFSSSATFDAAENQTTAGTVLATDSDAGDDVTGYAITGGADQAFFSIGATSGALTFDAAPNYEDAQDQGTNNTYVVTVQATSGTGTREKTATQTITVTVTDVGGEAPGKPAAPDVSAASGTSLTVTWTAPANAGPAITDYDVQYREGTSGSWTDGNHTGTATTATLSGLSENTSYQVQVRATNDEGTGDWSDSGSGTPDANAAPSFTSSAAFDAAENQTAAGAVLARDSDTEDNIEGYAITGGADEAFFSIGATDGVLTFDDAPNFEDAKDADTDNEYEVEVQATSGTGTRVKTATQAITVTVTDDDTEAPGAPDAPTVTAASATSLTVTWEAPDNAGPAITGYDVQYRAGTSGSWTDGNHIGTSTTATLSSLSENTSYQVQVQATNDEGTGDWSDSGSGSTMPPDPPDGFMASSGNAQVTLTWTAPDAGADITRHEYQFKTTGDYPAAWTVIDDSAPDGAHEDWVVVTGLTNDVEYTFQLRAVNAAGASTAVEADPVTPTMSGICGRTEQVRDAIVAAIDGVSDCADVMTAELTGVTYLGIPNMGIRSLQSDDFSGLTALTGIRLDGNELSSLPDDPFTGLTALRTLYLHDNELSSLPAGVFTGLTALEQIRLHDNELSSLPAGVFTGLTALQEIQLQNNELGSLPAGVFTGLTALWDLRLQNNKLGSLPAGAFTGLTALQRIQLQNNELSSLPDDPFTGLTALWLLYLYDNELSSLPDDVFTGLTALQEIRLQNNELSSLPDDVFTGLTVLKEIRLHDNELISLPEDPFTGLTALKHLWLQNNELISLPEDPFTDLTALIILTLSDNELSSLPDDVFTGLTALKHLWLANNKLSSLPDDPFTGLTALEQLWLADNALISLPDDVFTGLTSLKRLWLADNALISLPDDVFTGLTSLIDLYMENNELSSLPDDPFTGLTALEEIHLENNKLSSLPAGAFTGLTQLDSLQLQGNTEAPLPLTVTLEKVGSDQVRAEVLTGAPFAVDIPVTVANGALDGGANTLGVAAGSVEGTPVTVTRTAGTTAAVTADIDLANQPSLPSGHDGYIFARAVSGLPKEVFPSTDANAVPAFTSSATFDAAENQTSAGTVTATDSDTGDNIEGYALTGGADQTFFSIGATSGALTFKTAPNFEDAKDIVSVDPANDAGNNTYVVVVTATSGTDTRVKTATQTITVTVTDVAGEAPGKPAAPDVSAASVTSLTVTWSAPANAGPAITDYDVQYREGTSGSWTDGGHTGTAVTATLSSLSENTSYQVQVQATNDEGTGDWSDSGSGTTDANAAPSFSSSATFDAAENQTTAGTVLATDGDTGDDITGYALTGGADQTFFSIGATSGALTFDDAPNFEDAEDQGTDNTYVVTVQATSGTGTRVKTATQTITVTVTDVGGEAPGKPNAPDVSAASVTSLTVRWTAPANAGPAITDYDVQYREGTSGSWTDGGHTGTAVTATLSGLSENTSYQVQVRATNDEGTGSWSDSGSGTTDANAAPTFSSSATFDAAENQTTAGTVLATDGDTGDDITGYALTGGADQTFFSIGATSGALTFDDAPNFEDAEDQGTDNTYVVTVQATSGTGTRVKTATQTITVTVTDVGGEAPGKPNAPDVSAASVSSLTVTWTAPANAGPAITDYDVQYREGTSGSWTDGNHTGTALTATVSSLSEGTSYQVQVRATNDEGIGAWSDAGTGATDAEPEEEAPEPENQPSEIWAYWTDSDTKGSNVQDGCASTEPFRAFWNPPEINGSFKVADEWEAEITPENGASDVSFTIQNTGGDPKEPELTGTVQTDGFSVLSMRVRGRFGDDGWGAWSPTTELFCMTSAAKKPLGLAPNVPNPFNPSTVISYRLATPGAVRLEIYNLLGQPVRTLVDQVQAAGAYRVRWDARDARGAAVAAGVYLVRLHYPGGVQTKRLLYLK